MAAKKKEPPVVIHDTWRETQELLRNATTKDQVLALIKKEKKGQNRPLFLGRMAGRYKLLRNAEDDANLAILIGG